MSIGWFANPLTLTPSDPIVEAFKPEVKVQHKEVDLSFRPSMSQSSLTIQPDPPLASLVNQLRQNAVIQKSNHDISLIIQVNRAMKAQNLPLAELLLRRKLTASEIQNGRVTSLRAKNSPIDKVEVLKMQIAAERMKQEQLHELFKKLKPRDVPAIITKLFTSTSTETSDLDGLNEDDLETVKDEEEERTSTQVTILESLGDETVLVSSQPTESVLRPTDEVSVSSPPDLSGYDSMKDSELKPIMVELREEYPWLVERGELLSNLSGSKLNKVQRIKEVQMNPMGLTSADVQGERGLTRNQELARKLQMTQIPGVLKILTDSRDMTPKVLDAAVTSAIGVFNANRKRPQPVIKQKGKGINSGLRQVKYPEDYVPLGKRYFINAKKLKNGVFSLIHPSGQKPSWVNNTGLSSQVKQLLLSYLNNEPLDISTLEGKEKRWFTTVWEKAGLAPQKQTLETIERPKFTKKFATNRLKVLIGEIEAGNNSDIIVEELKNLAQKMNDRGWLCDKLLELVEKAVSD